MYRENKTITNSYDEKALFSRGTSSSLHTIVFLSYSDISRCYLFNKPKSNCLIAMTYYKSSVLYFLHNRINTMTTKCILCNAIVHPLRSKLGIDTCIHCGDKQAKQRKHCIVPMHKSNYIVVTNHDDLVRINNKSG
jgi:ribosomal protein L37AE/L43A